MHGLFFVLLAWLGLFSLGVGTDTTRNIRTADGGIIPPRSQVAQAKDDGGIIPPR